MHQTWSAYRITLLLYLGVLILPFTFVYTYNSIQSLASDTTVMRQISQNGGEMLAFVEISDEKIRKNTKVKIDKNLKELQPWFQSNERKEFYVGGKTLQKDFNVLLDDWDKLKNDPNKRTALTCWKTAKSLNFTIDKMLSLKQNKIENIFYINMIIAIIFLLLMIYLVRVYIHLQMKKHAIHDHETKLFNKKYFLSELKTSCARSQRYQYPLSMLSISIDNFEKYDKEIKKHMLQAFGGLLISLSRESDVVCRYDDNHFMILLPDQKEEGLSICHQRIQEALEKHDFQTTPKPEFTFSDTHYTNKESDGEFLTRSLSGLK